MRSVPACRDGSQFFRLKAWRIPAQGKRSAALGCESQSDRTLKGCRKELRTSAPQSQRYRSSNSISYRLRKPRNSS